MLKDKFTMELVWHNCITCPPTENHNYFIMSNGDDWWPVEYWAGSGWFLYSGLQFSKDELSKLYWADISQTAKGTVEFQEVLKLWQAT